MTNRKCVTAIFVVERIFARFFPLYISFYFSCFRCGWHCCTIHLVHLCFSRCFSFGIRWHICFPVESNKGNYKKDVVIWHWFDSVWVIFALLEITCRMPISRILCFVCGHTMTPYTMHDWCVCMCLYICSTKCGRYSSVEKNFSPFLHALSLSPSTPHCLSVSHLHTRTHKFIFFFEVKLFTFAFWVQLLRLGFIRPYICVVLHTRNYTSIPFLSFMHLLYEQFEFLRFFLFRRR